MLKSRIGPKTILKLKLRQKDHKKVKLFLMDVSKQSNVTILKVAFQIEVWPKILLIKSRHLEVFILV